MATRELVSGDDHIRFLSEAMAGGLVAQGLIHECSSCSEQSPELTAVYHVSEDAGLCDTCQWPYALADDGAGDPELCPGCRQLATFPHRRVASP